MAFCSIAFSIASLAAPVCYGGKSALRRVQTSNDTCVSVESQLRWVQDRALNVLQAIFPKLQCAYCPHQLHITPVLAQLLWLPIKFRMDFQVLPFFFKALKGIVRFLALWALFFYCAFIIVHHKLAQTAQQIKQSRFKCLLYVSA